MVSAVIIPARYGSTRFPGKPLSLISGKTMIERVVNSALGSKLVEIVIVATEDERIFNFIQKVFSSERKVKVFMTSPDHKSGTDRIAEVVKNNPEITHAINLQGDEPLMPPEYIDKALSLLSVPGCDFISSLITPVNSADEISNPNIVKAIMDKNNYALYFSRSVIPFNRNNQTDIQYYKHIGIYGFTRDTILKFTTLKSLLEDAEGLEQLRALENGIKIKLGIVPKSFPAVDRQEDIKTVEKILLETVKI